MRSCGSGINATSVSGFPERLALEGGAVDSGHSVSSDLVQMPHQRLGAEQQPYRDLDFLVGVWSDEEWEAFEGTLREQRRIDPELPK